MIKDGACDNHKSGANPLHEEKLSETHKQRKIHYIELYS